MRLFTMFCLVAAILCAQPALAAPSPAKHLPVETVVIDTSRGKRIFTMEIAADPVSQERGLMFRKKMERNSGMLFDFRRNVMTAFWMKDTYLSLDMIFIRADGTISSIARNTVPLSTTEVQSSEPVRAVVEIKGGRARELGIEAGDLVHASAFGNLVGRQRW